MDNLQPAVILQAAGDADMFIRGSITGIRLDTDRGASGTVPLVQMDSGLCLPSGTSVQIEGAPVVTNIPNGVSGLIASNVQGQGGSSHFNGTDFYLRKANGDPLDNALSANVGRGGFVYHFLEDGDPRKAYGLPYTFISHEKTHSNSWIVGNQPGRSNEAARIHGDNNPRQRYNYRTKWDYIAPASGGTGTDEDGNNLDLNPGFTFGDKSNSFRGLKHRIKQIRYAGYNSQSDTAIHTEADHQAIAGDLFTVRNINTTSLSNLHTNLQGIADDPVYRIATIVDRHTFVPYTTSGSGYAAFPVQGGSTNAGDRANHDATVQIRGSAANTNPYMNVPSRMPTTTQFKLPVANIQHTFNDQTSVSPMPKNGVSGTVIEQVQNIGLSLGMRAEKIKISGTIVDTGPVTATNIRKQVFMNICRMQYLKIAGWWGGKPRNALNHKDGYPHSGNTDRQDYRGWGYGGPTNPRSYPCLTIYEPKHQTASTRLDTNADGSYNIYRGIITSLSFTQTAGRVDMWDYSLDFSVVTNEKAAANVFNYESGD